MDLPYDPGQAVRHLAKVDEKMGRVIEQFGPFSLALRDIDSPFEALLRAIVYQQLSTKAAATIFNRVLDLFPNRTLSPRDVISMEDDMLRGAGMSWAKIASANDLATKTIEGTVPALKELNSMSDADVIARLSEVRGIGRWTVEMLLIFNMGRPDVLPSTDLGVRKGFQAVYELDDLPAPKALDAFGESWRPYRSVASWYLWRVVDGDNDEW